MIRLVGAAFVAASVLFSVTPAQAATGVFVAPARVDVSFKPTDGAVKLDLKVINRSTYRDSFTVAPVDLLVRDNAPYPAGATPYGTSAHTTLTPNAFTLDPGQSIVVKVVLDVSAHRPMFGGLLVTPAVNGSGILAIPEVLVPITLAPLDWQGQLQGVNLALAPVRLKVPFLQESGPIVASAQVRNDGDFFARAYSTFEFSSFGHAFLRVQAPPGDAMPGQIAVTSATTRQALQVDGNAVDTAPWLCVCQVTVRTYAQLGNQRTVVPVVQTTTVIVLPWRLAGLVLAIIGGAWWGTRRRRRSS